jgi:replication factor C subunit 2/4
LGKVHLHPLRLILKNCSPENFRNRVLELNASDERGIGVVREKIKDFARQTPRAQADRDSTAKNYPCPPYKIIILDEADSMTQDAQGALRRIMESYARITRFCLVCNYVTRYLFRYMCLEFCFDFELPRIIEPLASRCSKFRFTPLDAASTTARLSYIAKQEDISIDPDVISALISVSSGDLRRAITYFQSAFRLSTSTQPAIKITSHDIQEIAGVVPDAVINDFVTTLGVDTMTSDAGIAGQKVRGFDGIRKKVAHLVREGYSASQLISQVCIIYASPLESYPNHSSFMMLSFFILR